MNRRDLLKNLTFTIGGTLVTTEVLANTRKEGAYTYAIPENPLYKPMQKPITVITMGAGGRGNVYGSFAVAKPDMMNIIGVAEPVKYRNDKFARIHNIENNNRFVTWEDVLKRPKFADAVMITMPDHLHYKPCMEALKKGYDVLLEKPIAQTEQQCRDILNMVKKTGRIVAICHVLRYAPYFIKMRELINKGAIGEVVSLQQLEPVWFPHMAHSYVRGNWHNSKISTPMIISKSCHDLDIIKWIVGKNCKRISAMGGLRHFKRENAPEGSTEFCISGCKVERQCPYSAVKTYLDKMWWHYVLDVPENLKTNEEIKKFVADALTKSDYGRCVYRMDNDQPDHYITNIEFENNITASFSMEAFTQYNGRRTRIFGTMGQIEGDQTEFTLYDFRTEKELKFVPKVEDASFDSYGHGGGDWMIAKDFCQAVAQQNPAILTSTVDASIESHIMGFRAEESRKKNKVMEVKI